MVEYFPKFSDENEKQILKKNDTLFRRLSSKEKIIFVLLLIVLTLLQLLLTKRYNSFLKHYTIIYL